MTIEIDLLSIEGESESGVLRAVVTGQLQEQDYHDLSARIEALLDKRATLRLLVEMIDFQGWSAGAAWEDAKLGYRHFADFDRLAVVGDKQWEQWMVRLAGPFTLADTQFFEASRLEEAREWITEPPHPSLRISIEEERRVVRVRPHGRLSQADFIQLAGDIDPLIERWGSINGLVIESRDFPGWESVGALIRHLRFVSGHHKRIHRIALVTDSSLGAIAEHVASHFMAAQIKQFEPEDLDIALDWAAKAGDPAETG